MKSIKFKTREDFLLEENLEEFLKLFFKGEEIIYNKRIDELGFRPDYYLPNRKLIIEFDGPVHFVKNSIAVLDIQKDLKVQTEGFTIIRIPYFTQLNWSNIFVFFGKFTSEINPENDFNNYPNGFVDKNVILPGDFSSLGLSRYKKFMNQLDNKDFPDYVAGNCDTALLEDIRLSLIIKYLKGKDFFEVFPETDLKSVKSNFKFVKEKAEERTDLVKLRSHIKNTLNINIK